LKRAKLCYSSISEKKKLLLCQDWMFVQHLLPCIVVSFLEAARKCEKADADNLERNIIFINNLINSYEENPIWTSIYKKDFHGTYEIYEDNAYFWQADKLWTILSKAIPDSIQGLRGLKNFIDVCVQNSKKSSERGRAIIWRFLCRLRHVLRQSICFPIEEEKNAGVSDLLILCRLIVINSCEEGFFDDDEDDFDIASTFPELALQVFDICSKHEGVSLHRLKRSKPGALSNVNEHFKQEAVNLSEQQLFGIIIYTCLHFPRPDKDLVSKRKKEMCKPSPFDPVEIAYYSYLHNDEWMLKKIVTEWLNDENGVDRSTVSHKFALENAPVCYAIPMQDISRKMKLKMDFPGQFTFCPIRHCRWCGIIEQETVFKVCSLCEEEPEYADKNIFCSVDCEREALGAQHTEEHARFYQVKCGIED
jgi:hypothetical protein